MKNPDQLKLLFEKYLSNSCTLEETQGLMDYFHIAEEQNLLKELVFEALDHQDESYSHNPIISNLIARVDTDLFDQIHAAVNEPASIKAIKRLRAWPRAAIAAAVATMIFGAGLFLYKTNQKNNNETIAYQQDVAPGKQGATLTLANGRKIRLNNVANGELANEGGVVISKAANGQLVYEIKRSSGISDQVNTLSTSNGETYRLRLPDGSYVWLNSASSLTYSSKLIQNGKRTVKLYGEGYFEIAKDKAHPFVVATDQQNVEVLGTHFNISSFKEDIETKTTLLEGSVKIYLNGKNISSHQADIVLKPNQQAILNKDGFNMQNVDAEDVVAWKNGYFKFNEESIQSIMRKLSRWYNIEVRYDTGLPDELFTGRISRYKNISQVLNLMQADKSVKFKIDGRRITVMK